ncbi:MAG TPA: glutathione synthase [Gammaproteobacteria bacterium]|nr:glutathione synthase [Gammaproteobacteria bacterium]
MKIAFVVNDLHTEEAGYTTTHLAMEAANRGHEVWYINVADFSACADDVVRARAYPVPRRHFRRDHSLLQALRTEVRPQRLEVDELDVLILRNDPSVDAVRRPWARLAGINFGRLAMRNGVITLNDPNSLAQAVNKLYTLLFPEEVRPRTLITRDRQEILEFLEAQGGTMVIKPLTGSGGRNVFLVRPEDAPNLNQMIDAVSYEGFVIAQEYLPAVQEGDTRLFMLNGRVLEHQGHYAAVHRVRPGDDIRSNMTAGGKARRARVTKRMLELAEIVRPRLVQDGMFLVGLDIVGDKLVEINVFSPGGLNSAQRLEGVNFCRLVIQSLERKVEFARHHHRHFDNVEIAVY